MTNERRDLAEAMEVADKYLTAAHVAKEIADEAVTRLEEVLEMLTVIRDADEDCIRDGLPRRIPQVVRTQVDAAIARVRGSR